MRALRLPPSLNWSDTTWRRIRSVAIALAIELLLALALLSLSAIPGLRLPPQAALTLFNVDPDAVPATKSAARKAATPQRTPSTTPPPKVPVVPPTPVTLKRPIDAPPQMIVLSRDDYAGSDIGKLPKGDGGGGGGSGADSGTTYGPGAGPGGQPLYNAEWYREPSHAEIAGYLPPNVQAGAAMIACRTIENYHVENCQSLGEEPAGTGLARAMRQAAWQFLVRPPRRGGKVLIGAWVRIRFDLTTGVEK